MAKLRYRYIFATWDHEPITTLRQLRSYKYHARLGLFLGKTCIGSGELFPMGPSVHTEAVEIKPKYRSKGHGIALYLSLIRAAKRLGAQRIYSSMHLNKRSRHMWTVTLPRFFDVSVSRKKVWCRRCRNSAMRERYFIKLTK
jgi:GNAT superfamily N-acetyltransferase